MKLAVALCGDDAHSSLELRYNTYNIQISYLIQSLTKAKSEESFTDETAINNFTVGCHPQYF